MWRRFLECQRHVAKFGYISTQPTQVNPESGSGINVSIEIFTDFGLYAMIIEDSRNLPLNRLLLFALRCKPLVEIFPHPSCSFCKLPMKMFL